MGLASHLLVTLGELRRAPARDGMSDELARRHEPSEADEDHHRVEARQPIRVVVVGAKLDFLDTQQRFRQSIHVANHDFVLVLFGESFACLQHLVHGIFPCKLKYSLRFVRRCTSGIGKAAQTI